MVGKIIPTRSAVDTLTRLNCCAALFIATIKKMQAAGVPQSSLLCLVGTCDLLEAIIQDFYKEVGAAECVTMTNEPTV